ncbi:MAG TPA: hypothetical protein VGF21_03610 [Thermoleophilaceae bacterium]
MSFRPLPSPGQAVLSCVLAAAAALASGGLFAAAALAPAPPAALPLLILICIGCPVLAAWELPVAVAVLRQRPRRQALSELLRGLDELPETEHPLGY